VMPNKSPEPTAVGAVRSAVAVHIAIGGGSAFFVRRLMRRVICISASAALSVLLIACQRKTEIVAPKEADSAVAVAKMYLKTNGIIDQPILQAAEFRDGFWRLELVSASSRKSDLNCWIIGVSSNGQIVMTYGPH
jgi:hypothetical protein